MAHRLGVDVGGTFTDVLLIDTDTGRTWRAKTASTPQDQSVGVLRGIQRVTADAGIGLADVTEVLHGTTVATNAILEGKGATVGLITTQGFRQVLQIARSFVPGGLAGWIIWPKPEPLAALENTVEAVERVASDGTVVTALDADDVRAKIVRLKEQGIQALAVSLINSFANPDHEKQIGAIALEVLGPDVPVSLSSHVLPELREYERTITTVANGYVQPQVARYVDSLAAQLADGGVDGPLYILRSDGGLASASAAAANPVNLLLSGPAGGVTGAAWAAEQAGYRDFLTFDMGGTSTDVGLVQDLVPRIGRQTRVGDLDVRAASVDVRTVGAGGGSIAHVPPLTQALRVGPQSAGAVPGPAAYGQGGEAPTVTDANVVLGYLPSSLAGGEITLDVEASRAAVQTIADATTLDSVEAAASGIVDIVNENMFGALRLVSVQQGFDPRDFALVAFGGAGPLHANALGRLTGSWPVIIPPSPGVLCAYGDATTSLRDESARTYIRQFSDTTDDEIRATLDELAAAAKATLRAEGVDEADMTLVHSVDLRYHGQGFEIPVTVDVHAFDGAGAGLAAVAARFDAEHERLFGFLLKNAHEVVTLRASATGPRPHVAAEVLPEGDPDPAGAKVLDTDIWVSGGRVSAGVYDRSRLAAGAVVTGPAIITEMDSTTLVLPDHAAEVHPSGSLLITPVTPPPLPPGQEGGDMARILETATTPVQPVEVDVITLDLVENALRNARYEMDEVLFRTALSPGIREQHDEFPLIADPEGKMVVGQFGLSIPDFLDNYDGTIEEGDVLLTSDPYSCGAAISHANDWLVVMPVFHSGRVVGWASMFGHMSDVGGKTASSMPTDARTIFEEGVIIPPFKLYKQGVLAEESLEIILNQVRKPDWNRADLNGIVAACRTAGRRIQEMCDRFGTDTYLSALDALLARNHSAMKTLLAMVFEDGKSIGFTDYICDDGVGFGPYELKMTLTRTGDKVTIDFTGSSPQAAGPINYYINENLIRMFFGIYMITVADPQILWNDGFYPLVDVVIPEDSFWKPRFPAALSGRNHGIGRVFDLLGGLLGQTNPQLMNAAGFSSSPHFMYSGTYSEGEQKGEWFQLYSIGFGGIPGRPMGDGPDGHSLWPSFTNIPCEYLESYYPLRIEKWETVADTGGSGLHRGGNGVDVAYRFLSDGEIAIHDDRWLTYPWGVLGGEPGARGTKWVERLDGTREVLPSKCHDVPVKAGELLHFVTWGGGGWGDPLARDPELVALEVRRGLVTVEGARRYGVVLGADGGVDTSATGALRAEMGAGRPDPLPIFDSGPPMEEILANALAETGLPAPRPPVARV